MQYFIIFFLSTFLSSTIFGQVFVPADFPKNYSHQELLVKISNLKENVELKTINRKNDDGSQGYLIFFLEGKTQKIKYQTDVEAFFEKGENTKSWLPISIENDFNTKPNIETKNFINQVIEENKSNRNWVVYSLIIFSVLIGFILVKKFMAPGVE